MVPYMLGLMFSKKNKAPRFDQYLVNQWLKLEHDVERGTRTPGGRRAMSGDEIIGTLKNFAQLQEQLRKQKHGDNN